MFVAQLPAIAATMAAVGVFLIVLSVWQGVQARTSATVLLVARARGELAELNPRLQPHQVLRRIVGRLAGALGPVAGPLGSRAVADRLAWLGSNETAEQFLARQVLAAAAGAGVGLLLPAVWGHAGGAGVLGPLGAAVGWWLPWQELESRCRSLRRRLGREALGWADFLAAAVQAGLPLEAAITRLALELPGRLPQMLARAVRESELTREPLDLCLAAAAAQMDEPHVFSVVGAITQARQTGSDLAGPLAGMVSALRQERQQELRTAARGRSTWGALPLIFVMLPGVMLPLAYIVLAQFRALAF
jgi:Flp pilus assembly protein TadB